MTEFKHSLARIAVWNLAGYNQKSPSSGIGPNTNRAKNQAKGLALLDAELVTLVEVSPMSHLDRLSALLESEYGLDYDTTIIQQPHGHIHIGFLHKPGVDVSGAQLIAGSEGNYGKGRQAVQVDVKIGKFKATVIAVHLKSGRKGPQQLLRDSQCQAIGAHIAQLRQTPGLKTRTILLMGDFNMIPGQDVSNFHHLGGDDIMDFVSSWDLQERFSHILDKGRANLLDGFAVSRTYATDYVRGSLRWMSR